jgi:hypothetical protein
LAKLLATLERQGLVMPLEALDGGLVRALESLVDAH